MNTTGAHGWRWRHMHVRGLVAVMSIAAPLIGVVAAQGAGGATTTVSTAPTLSVTPSENLIGNRIVLIRESHWLPNGDVIVSLCSSDPLAPNAECAESGDVLTASSIGAWSMSYAPVNPQAPVECAPRCYVEAHGFPSTTLVAELTAKTPTVSLYPNDGGSYYDLQRITVRLRGFPAGDPITVEVCDQSGLATCDPDTAATITMNQQGSGAALRYALNENVCFSDGACGVLAMDPAYPNGQVAFATFDGYCGPIVCPGGLDRPAPGAFKARRLNVNAEINATRVVTPMASVAVPPKGLQVVVVRVVTTAPGGNWKSDGAGVVA